MCSLGGNSLYASTCTTVVPTCKCYNFSHREPHNHAHVASIRYYCNNILIIALVYYSIITHEISPAFFLYSCSVQLQCSVTIERYINDLWPKNACDEHFLVLSTRSTTYYKLYYLMYPVVGVLGFVEFGRVPVLIALEATSYCYRSWYLAKKVAS